ncbi:MAG: hypothetical protein ACYCTV_07015 [Leptospirales bacterium]
MDFEPDSRLVALPYFCLRDWSSWGEQGPEGPWVHDQEKVSALQPTVQHTFHLFSVQLHRSHSFKLSTDPRFVEKFGTPWDST